MVLGERGLVVAESGTPRGAPSETLRNLLKEHARGVPPDTSKPRTVVYGTTAPQ